MKAGIVHAQKDIRYGDFPEPEIKSGCVKIRVRACGICGSDVPRVLGTEAHYYPIVLGHEFSGDVVEAGDGVKSLKPGDRVAGVPLIPCKTCPDCQNGDYALCKNYSFIGSREQGAFAEYIVVPESNAVKIGDTVSYTMGALFEPAAVALHGIFCAGFKDGADTVILGTGNIGILAMQWARIFGASRIAVVDILPERLELAKELGADVTFNPIDPNFSEQVKEFTNGRGFKYVFETAGQPATIRLCFELAGNKASICCIGTPHKDFEFSWKQWELMNRKEFRLTGTWMSYSPPFPGNEWTLTAHYFGNGELKLHDSMICKTMPLSEISEAFELFKTPGKVKGKLIIEC